LEVRHVTLSSGQLAAAAASLGPDLLSQGVFWWCVAGVALTGVLNVGVSFYLAFLLALKAHNVSGVDRGRIYRAIRQRSRSHLLSFLWPERPSSPPPTDTTHG
jgi:site-specific recombinase